MMWIFLLSAAKLTNKFESIVFGISTDEATCFNVSHSPFQQTPVPFRLWNSSVFLEAPLRYETKLCTRLVSEYLPLEAPISVSNAKIADLRFLRKSPTSKGVSLNLSTQEFVSCCANTCLYAGG